MTELDNSLATTEISRPFSGVRVLEFTHVWAGPLCGQLLADAGADVVKIESHGHIDVHRRAGPYAQGAPDINASGVWNAQNRGKRSVAINLKDRQGVDIALDLASAADVVIDNFRPGVLNGLGLSHEAVLARRPSLVGVSISGFGLDEKWRNYPAYGPTMDAIAGLAVATADSLGRPQAVNGWLPDVSASLFACVAIASALENPGAHDGQWFDIDELVSTLALLPEQAEMESRGSHDEVVESNRYAGGDICLALPCRGEDEWIAVRLPAAPDERWLTALEVVRDLHDNPASGDLPGATIVSVNDAVCALSAATSQLDKNDASAALQRVGYEAVPVNAAPDLLNDPDLRARDSYVIQKLPGGYELKSYGSVIRWNKESRLGRVAPQFGEHTFEVLGQWLGYSPDHLAELARQENLFW